MLTLTLDAGGRYTFNNLASGESYTITPEPGREIMPRRQSVNPLTRDELHVNFARATPTPTPIPTEVFKISGRIHGRNGRPLSGIKVLLTGGRSAPARTGSEGDYVFSNLPAGRSYSVIPELTGWNPVRPRRLENLSQDVTTVNFVLVPAKKQN